MTAMREAVRETPDGGIETEIQDGEDVGIDRTPNLDAIDHMYEEAKACIAESIGWPPSEMTEPWPETKAIDLRAIQPPAPSRRSSSAPDLTSSARRADAPACELATDRLVVPRRAWRRWFSLRAGESVVTG